MKCDSKDKHKQKMNKEWKLEKKKITKRTFGSLFAFLKFFKVVGCATRPNLRGWGFGREAYDSPQVYKQLKMKNNQMEKCPYKECAKRHWEDDMMHQSPNKCYSFVVLQEQRN